MERSTVFIVMGEKYPVIKGVYADPDIANGVKDEANKMHEELKAVINGNARPGWDLHYPKFEVHEMKVEH